VLASIRAWQKLGLDDLVYRLVAFDVVADHHDGDHGDGGVIIIRQSFLYHRRQLPAHLLHHDGRCITKEDLQEDVFIEHRVEYTIDRVSSAVEMTNEVVIGGSVWHAIVSGDDAGQGALRSLPRVGLAWEVPHDARLTYYGRGPHENYPDRNRGYG
jgi:hypothetical protein